MERWEDNGEQQQETAGGKMRRGRPRLEDCVQKDLNNSKRQLETVDREHCERKVRSEKNR